MKKVLLTFLCLFVTHYTLPLSFQSLAKIASIVTVTGLLSSVRVEHPALKALFFPVSLKMQADNKERVLDINVQLNLVPVIVGYWALQKL